MELNINSPKYYKDVYGVDDEIYRLCQDIYIYFKDKSYSEIINIIGIIPIIAPKELLENGKYKEPIFGKAYLTIGSSFDEMEYTIDLKAAADYFGLNESDLKLIQAKYHRIGQEWVSIAGTSSGPLMGISLCGLSVLAVLGYRRKKTNQKVI